MDNAKHINIITKIIIFFLCFSIFCGLSCGMIVSADSLEGQVSYCDEGYYSGDTTFGDEDSDAYAATYDVYYESITTENVALVSAPSFGNSNPDITNYCAVLAGCNIVGYYDRWYTNLIPDFEPGMLFTNGEYHYYPDLAFTQSEAMKVDVYNAMQTNVGTPGTTSTKFKNGLSSYVSNAGYSLSYSSIYGTSTSVDLQKLTTAVNQNKVCLVMCSKYNYISSITNVTNDSRMHVVKKNSTIAHMMMVYGYYRINYFASGSKFRTDTFLYVCSSYGSGDKGYMLLDDFLTIEEAYVMSIS